MRKQGLGERRITGKGNMMTNAETGIIHSEVDEGGATSQGMQTSTEDEKDEEAGFLLELLEGIQPCQHLDISPVILSVDF